MIEKVKEIIPSDMSTLCNDQTTYKNICNILKVTIIVPYLMARHKDFF